MRCRVDCNSSDWEKISPEAKWFVKSLLQLDPDTRLDADEALDSEWLGKQYRLSDRRPDEELLNTVRNTLVSYADSGEFKKLTLMLLAHKANTKDVLRLREVFDQYDSSNDGNLTLAEFKKALQSYGHDEDDLDHIFDKMVSSAD